MARGDRRLADYELLLDGESVAVTDWKGDVCVISKEDVQVCRPCSITVHKNGRAYAYTPEGNETRLYRLILSAQKGQEVDHANRCSWDNRRDNIRLCTRSENTRNRSKEKKVNASSRFKGVFWNGQRQRWMSRGAINKKGYHLGTFRKEEDAARAYDRFAIANYGAFALTNERLGYYKER